MIRDARMTMRGAFLLWRDRNQKFEIMTVPEDDFSTSCFATDAGNGVSGRPAGVAK